MGIDEINKALTHVDEITQQNSALVEENAATARVLAEQAAAMNERVGAFQLDEATSAADAVESDIPPYPTPQVMPKPVVARRAASVGIAPRIAAGARPSGMAHPLRARIPLRAQYLI